MLKLVNYSSTDESEKEEINEERDLKEKRKTVPSFRGHFPLIIQLIPDKRSSRFFENFQKRILQISNDSFTPLNDFHLSLSRTASVGHNLIGKLWKELEEVATNSRKILTYGTCMRVLSSETTERNFFVVEVKQSFSLKSIIDRLNLIFKLYRLENYLYENLITHVTIGIDKNHPSSTEFKLDQKQIDDLLEEYLCEIHFSQLRIDIGHIHHIYRLF
ncbi:hypothetical protein SNEBB_011193 [Seison nebaliae]|nr:hypothetical protein SNEBB_011193 [Seison nebaliae]